MQAYRSILLKYEKEVDDSGFDSKRAAFILKEVTGMQEVVFDRIQQAGRDARKLGVPPEEIEQTMQIYKRTLAGAMVQYMLNYEYVFGHEANTFLALIDADENRAQNDPVRIFAGDIRAARMLMNHILGEPNTAFMMFPVLAKRLPLIEAGWKSLGWSTSNSGNSSPPPPCVRLDVASKFIADDPRRSDPTCKEIGIQRNSKNRP